MRKIEFHSVHATNFKVFKDFAFYFDQFGPGCHAITGKNLAVPRLGSNGVGKSSIWDAVSFGLFGFTCKRLRSTDIQTYGSDANPHVELVFSVDGTRYQIDRTAVPHALSVDGERCNQERLDLLLAPLDIDLFLQTVVFAQGQPLFLDLEPRHKLTLLSDVLRLERFAGYSDKAKAQLDQLKGAELQLALRHESVTGSIAEVGRLMSTVRSKGEDWQTKKRDRIRELTDAYRAADRAASDAAATLRDLTAELEDLQREKNALHPEFLRLDMLRVERARLQREAQRGTCPTCGQPLPHKHVELPTFDEHRHAELFERLNWLVDRYALVEPGHRQALTELNRLERAFNQADAALTEAKLADDPFKEEHRKLRDRLSELHREERAIVHQREEQAIVMARVEPWVAGFKELRLMVLDEVLGALALLTTSYTNDIGLPVDVAYAIERTAKAGHAIAGVHVSVEGGGRFEAWSGGEAQRLRLAASLALSATLLAQAGLSIPLLVLDEPSAALSPEGLAELVLFLGQHAESEGRVIFITDQRPLRLPTAVTLERTADNVVIR